MTMLTKSGFGKVLPGIDLLIPSEVESSTMTDRYPEDVDFRKEMAMTMNPEESPVQSRNMGGMMDIDYLTRKLR